VRALKADSLAKSAATVKPTDVTGAASLADADEHAPAAPDTFHPALGTATPLATAPAHASSGLSVQLDQKTGSALAELIREALADKHLAADEWAVLGSMVNMLPLMAGPECRQLLQVFAADHTIDPAVRGDLVTALRSRGYPVPRWPPAPIDVAQVIAQNVTEVDRRFEELCERLGVPNVTQLVAVLDGGFDVTHPLLSKAADAPHADFAALPQGVSGTDASHGTHVAGIATQGTHRLAPLCINVLAPAANGRSLELRGFEAAVEHAVAHGALVMNVSILTTDPAEVAQVRRAVLAHPEVLFVLGAGNNPLPLGEGKFAPELHVGAQPFDNVCVVTSVKSERVASYAAYGGTTAIAAEGDVLSAAPRAQFAFMSGTSMAAPQVASVAARCKLLDPALDPVRLQRILELTVDSHDGLRDVVRSGGALNGTRACWLTAVARLVHEGSTCAHAFETLAIPGDERESLLILLRVLDA
jgi:Subtilase family